MNKRRILIISPRPPYPLFSGGHHAQFHFIGELLKKMDVSVCFEVDDQSYSGYSELLKLWEGVTFYPLLNLKQKKTILDFYRWTKCIIRKIKGRILSIFQSRPVKIEDPIKYESFINMPIFPQKAPFVNHVADIISKNQFDVIQIDFISLAPLIYILPEGPIKILVHHEIRYIRIKREMDLFKKTDAFDLCRFRAIKDEEILLLRKFNKIITLTEKDKEILSLDIPSEKIYVSPASIPVLKTGPVTFIPFKNKLVFIGSSGHLPNTDGVDWFINEILPAVEKEIPDIKLEIIGRWESEYKKKYQKRNIVFSGFIENLETVFSSSLLIVPIRIGSGMRLKIIEAVNQGIPFITTTIGVEGLNFKNNIDCIIADSHYEFAKGIHYLSENPFKQQDFIKNASEKLSEKYSYDESINKRLDFYRSLT
jgi:glycosyltransferase involved in cell wall biosynthesis